MIISKKTKEEEIVSEGIANMSTLAKIAQVLNSVDLTRRYN